MLHGDRGDFDSGAADKASDLHCRSGGFGIGHKLFVDFVHFFDIVQVRDVDRDGNDVCHGEAGFFDDFFHGCDGVRRLENDVRACNFAMRVRTLLTSNVQRIPGHVALAEWHALGKTDGLMLGESDAASKQEQ